MITVMNMEVALQSQHEQGLMPSASEGANTPVMLDTLIELAVGRAPSVPPSGAVVRHSAILDGLIAGLPHQPLEAVGILASEGGIQIGGDFYDGTSRKLRDLQGKADELGCDYKTLPEFPPFQSDARLLIAVRDLAARMEEAAKNGYEDTNEQWLKTYLDLKNPTPLEEKAIPAPRRQASTSVAVSRPGQPGDYPMRPLEDGITNLYETAALGAAALTAKGLETYDAIAARIKQAGWKRVTASIVATSFSVGAGNVVPIPPEQLYSANVPVYNEGNLEVLSEAGAVPIAVPEEASGAGETSRITSVSEALVDVIKDSESWQPELYNDDAGNATIGYGHLVKQSPIDGTEPEEFQRGLTEEQGLDLLRQDIARFEQAVTELVTVPLEQNQFDALVSFAFNVGDGAFERSELLEQLNQGKYEAIPEELMKWIHAGGEAMGGLFKRRIEEVEFWNCEPDKYGPVEAVAAGSTLESETCGGLLATDQSNQITIVEVEGIQVREEIAPNLAALLAAARAAGFELTSASDYRSRHEQWELRIQNCPNPVTSSPSECTPDTAHADNPYTSEIEGSRHQFGEAVDFRADGRSLISSADPAVVWLKKHGSEYGFNDPVSSEPWHWESRRPEE